MTMGNFNKEVATNERESIDLIITKLQQSRIGNNFKTYKSLVTLLKQSLNIFERNIKWNLDFKVWDYYKGLIEKLDREYTYLCDINKKLLEGNNFSTYRDTMYSYEIIIMLRNNLYSACNRYTNASKINNTVN
jgi:hypothetical protein